MMNSDTASLLKLELTSASGAGDATERMVSTGSCREPWRSA